MNVVQTYRDLNNLFDVHTFPFAQCHSAIHMLNKKYEIIKQNKHHVCDSFCTETPKHLHALTHVTYALKIISCSKLMTCEK